MHFGKEENATDEPAIILSTLKNTNVYYILKCFYFILHQGQ